LRVDHELACEGARFTPTNRMDMIISLLAALEGRRLIIPRSPNCGFTTKNTDELIHELSSLIPVKTPSGTPTYKTVSKHDDCVMSLCLATSQLRSQQSGRVFGVVR